MQTTKRYALLEELRLVGLHINCKERESKLSRITEDYLSSLIRDRTAGEEKWMDVGLTRWCVWWMDGWMDVNNKMGRDKHTIN